MQRAKPHDDLSERSELRYCRLKKETASKLMRGNIAKKPLDVKAAKSWQGSNHTAFQPIFAVFTVGVSISGNTSS